MILDLPFELQFVILQSLNNKLIINTCKEWILIILTHCNIFNFFNSVPLLHLNNHLCKRVFNVIIHNKLCCKRVQSCYPFRNNPFFKYVLTTNSCNIIKKLNLSYQNIINNVSQIDTSTILTTVAATTNDLTFLIQLHNMSELYDFIDQNWWKAEQHRADHPLNIAVRSNSLQFLKYVYKHLHICYPACLFNTASKHGRIHIVKWMLKKYHYNEILFGTDSYYKPCYTGPININVLLAVCQCDQYDIYQLIKRYIPQNKINMIRDTFFQLFKNNNLKYLKLMYTDFNSALKNYNFPLSSYLDEKEWDPLVYTWIIETFELTKSEKLKCFFICCLMKDFYRLTELLEFFWNQFPLAEASYYIFQKIIRRFPALIPWAHQLLNITEEMMLLDTHDVFHHFCCTNNTYALRKLNKNIDYKQYKFQHIVNKGALGAIDNSAHDALDYIKMSLLHTLS